MKNFVQASVILVYERLGLTQKNAGAKEIFPRKTHREENARTIKYLFQWDDLFVGWFSKGWWKDKKTKEQIQQ